MDTTDESDASAPVIVATGLGVSGEHGPLFSGVDLELTPGFHAIQMPGGPDSDSPGAGPERTSDAGRNAAFR